jgi:monoamine oxidase
VDRRSFLALTGTALLPHAAARRLRPRVIVIGAGLAGLAAAWELTQAGAEVTVLEARQVPGGRVRTLRAPFADGLYGEAGALHVPDSHHLVRRQAEELGLRLVAIAPRPAGELYYVRGRRIVVGGDTGESWPLDLTPEERTLGLAGMWARYVGPALDEIGDPTTPGWPGPALAPYDGMTMAELLRARGASPDAVELLALGYLDLGGDGVDTYSALSMLRDLALRRGNRRYWAIAGGNDQLPAAMAARLGGRVCYGAPVIRIEPGPRTATVVTRQDGESRRWVADHVICTLPPPVLARLEVAPAFSPARRAAIAAIAATSLTRVFFQTRTRFWRTRRLPSSAVTDLPIRWVCDATATQPGARGILDAHVGGTDARRFAALPPSERVAQVLTHLVRLYPGADAEVEATAVMDWDAEPWARGAYAWFRPGQLTSVMRPLVEPEGRIHLAGEHLSSASGWMQGALDSGLRAARDVLAAGGWAARKAASRNGTRP